MTNLPIHFTFIHYLGIAVVLFVLISLRLRIKEWQLERREVRMEWRSFHEDWIDICRLYAQEHFKTFKEESPFEIYKKWVAKVPKRYPSRIGDDFSYSFFLTQEEFTELTSTLKDINTVTIY